MADALLVAVVRLGRACGQRVVRVVCDRGYSSASWRAGIRVVGPSRSCLRIGRTQPWITTAKRTGVGAESSRRGGG